MAHVRERNMKLMERYLALFSFHIFTPARDARVAQPQGAASC